MEPVPEDGYHIEELTEEDYAASVKAVLGRLTGPAPAAAEPEQDN